jgi:hypothetical protein
LKKAKELRQIEREIIHRWTQAKTDLKKYLTGMKRINRDFYLKFENLLILFILFIPVKNLGCSAVKDS